jgi:hypothetical protein
VSETTVDQDGWETIGEESGRLIQWDKPGDQFVGVFIGTRHIVPPDATSEDEEFDQQLFRSNEDGTGPGEVLWALNGGYKVRDALRPEYEGYLTRLTYTKNVDTGQPSPMRDIKVEAKRLS